MILIPIISIWTIGALLRIYRQARFYQIEEYMSLRYLRWLFSERTRWLPNRPLALAFLGFAIPWTMEGVPGQISFTSYIVASIAALIGVWPPNEGEIKKAFVRTQRATRMLGAAFVFTIILALVGLFLVNNIGISNDDLNAGAMGIAGLFIFLISPFLLILGNHAMSPVEAAIRQRYITQAEGVIEAIRPKIIGITGSYGKTTTKNYLRDILNGRYKTYATPKSYNTMMGVTLAINTDMADDYSIEYMISEMGAYIPGEIERICQLTPPEISIVVEVGPQHLERFGTLDNVAIAKYEIIKNLPTHGLGVFNWDNPYVREMYERGYPNNRIAVSKTASLDDITDDGVRFVATDIENTIGGLSFTITDRKTGESQHFETALVGEHNITNLLLATAVAVHEGMSLRDVAFRARMLQPAESRLVRQTTDTGITIINDSYSANPVGVVSALRVLGMHTTGKRLLITPGMVELGELQESENFKLGQTATEYATDIILVGEKQTQPLRKGIAETQFPQERVKIVDTLQEAIDWYTTNLRSGDTVLFLNDLPDTY